MKKTTFIFLSVLFCCAFQPLLAQNAAPAKGVLGLDDYLKQVGKSNPDILSANLSVDSLGKKVLEMDMIYSPIFMGNYTSIDDKSGPGYDSTLIAKELKATVWNFGLSKKWTTGSSTTLGYTNTAANLDLLTPYEPFGPSGPQLYNFNGYDIKPYLRLDQSLLRDFMSRLTKAGINKAKAATRAGQYMQVFRAQQTLFKARSTYLMLSLYREVVNFRHEELSRAEDILQWTQNRVDLDLADKGDLMQVQALYRLRKLTLQLALEDEKNTCRDFNELRGASSDSAAEELEKLSGIVSSCSGITELSRSGERADVLAARASYESSEYAKTETKYRSFPEISAYGMASLHGLDLMKYSEALRQVSEQEKPAYTVGVNLIVPLDFFTLAKVRKGYDLDYQSAGETLQKAEISAKKDWEKLLVTWNNVKARLAIAQEIQLIQSDRLANEQLKFKRGRTTMFQLIGAENDLDDATLNAYRLMIEELLTYYQVELYDTKSL
jgi:outer membrane protein TolC